MEFVNGGFEVDQTASNGFNLLFNKAADVKIADVTVNKIIKVGDGTGKLPQVVSNVAMSEDKKTASVSLFTNFENGATYEVSVKGYDEVAMFVASYGEAVSMTISSDSNMQNGLFINVGDVPAKLTYKLYDVEGNDVTNTVANGYCVFTAANTSTSDYYVDNGYLFIYKEGVEVTVNAEYHTNEFDANANEKVIKATGYFIGVSQAPVSVASTSIAIKYWGNALANNQAALNLEKVDLEVKIKSTAQNAKEIQYKNGAQANELAVNGVAPTVRYRSSNPDVLDLAKDKYNNDILVLFKEGTSAILVDLITYNADGSENVNTIAASYVTVAANTKVSNIVVANGGNIVVGAETEYNTADIQITAKDQYGSEWGMGNWTDTAGEVDENGTYEMAAFDKVKLANNAVLSEGTRGSIWLSPRRKATNWKETLVVNGDMFRDDLIRLGELKIDNGEWYVKDSLGNFSIKVTSVTKSVIVEGVGNIPGQNKDKVSFVVNVTLKRAVGNEVKSIEASGDLSGNVAMFNTPDKSWDNAETPKKATFKVVVKQNGVKTKELPLVGAKPSTASGSAVGDLYYTITRNNADISAATTNNGTSLTVDYSALDGYNVVYKKNGKDLGAGNYVFTVYEVKYNDKTKENYFAFFGSATANVTCDAGNYTYVKRLSEYVNAGFEAADLRNCFEINGLDGQKTNNTYGVDYTVGDNYVHVKSITFYEWIDAAQANAVYTVNVNVSLKIAK